MTVPSDTKPAVSTRVHRRADRALGDDDQARLTNFGIDIPTAPHDT